MLSSKRSSKFSLPLAEPERKPASTGAQEMCLVQYQLQVHRKVGLELRENRLKSHSDPLSPTGVDLCPLPWSVLSTPFLHPGHKELPSLFCSLHIPPPCLPDGGRLLHQMKMAELWFLLNVSNIFSTAALLEDMLKPCIFN